MSKQITVSIDTPCHENWDNMTKVEQGRFCASCQKNVIDFTGMSDSQIAMFFKKSTHRSLKEGSVCGKFYADQLDREIEIPGKRIPWVKYFFQFTLPAFLISMKATAQGNGKSKNQVVTRAVITKPGTDSVPVAARIVIPSKEKLEQKGEPLQKLVADLGQQSASCSVQVRGNTRIFIGQASSLTRRDYKRSKKETRKLIKALKNSNTSIEAEH